VPSTATIHDVADRAGVSIKTVSRVLNKEPNVRIETREKVLAAAEALRYRPSVSARSLAGSRSFLIALFLDNPSAAYVSDVQRGAVTRCREAGYHLVVEPLDSAARDAGDLVRATMATLRPDGAILSPPVGDRPLILEALTEMRAPYVRMAPDGDIDRAPYVYMDDHQAAYEMTRHLLTLGHRDIGFIIGHPDHGASHQRMDGFMQAMREQGVSVAKERVEQGFFSFQSGVTGAEALLSLAAPPTAIFASNDDMALGVMAYAHQRGISAPEELSVVGFDDTPAAAVWRPRLTTVRQPIYEMGFTAADMLITRARGEGWAAPLRVLPYAIMLRETTAAPRPAVSAKRRAGAA
jgi:LacI family transcriptional regulator